MGRRSAPASTAAATSFYPGKNLGAYGDAGAVLTMDAFARRAHPGDRQPRWHGEVRAPRAGHELPSRCAAGGRPAGEAAPARGMERGAAFSGRSLRRPPRRHPAVRLTRTAPGSVHVWHLYVVRVADRDRVIARLREVGVEAGIHYPAPIHLTPAYEWLGYRPGDLPVSEAASRSMISLPMHPHLTADDQARVVELLLEVTA